MGKHGQRLHEIMRSHPEASSGDMRLVVLFLEILMDINQAVVAISQSQAGITTALGELGAVIGKLTPATPPTPPVDLTPLIQPLLDGAAAQLKSIQNLTSEINGVEAGLVISPLTVKVSATDQTVVVAGKVNGEVGAMVSASITDGSSATENGNGTVAADGTFAVNVVLPAGTPAGELTSLVNVTSGAAVLVASGVVTVTA